MRLVKRRTDGDALGLLNVCHGYPTPDVLCLGLLFLRADQQKLGLGSELMTQLELELEAAEAGFPRIRLGVALKNWVGLRLWVRLGFRTITAFTGDLEYSETTYATMELEKSIGLA